MTSPISLHATPPLGLLLGGLSVGWAEGPISTRLGLLSLLFWWFLIGLLERGKAPLTITSPILTGRCPPGVDTMVASTSTARSVVGGHASGDEVDIMGMPFVASSPAIRG